MSKKYLVLANLGVLLGALVLSTPISMADTTKTDSSMETEDKMSMEKEASMKEEEMGMEKEASMKEDEMGMEKEASMKEDEMGMKKDTEMEKTKSTTE